MHDALIKKPKDTLADPERTAYRTYKFQLPEFDAPSAVVFFQNTEEMDGKHVIYGLVDGNCTEKKHFKVVCIPIEFVEKQQVLLPRGSFIFRIFFAPDGEQPPYPIQANVKIADPLFSAQSAKAGEERLFIIAIYSDALADDEFTIYIHGTGWAIYNPSVSHLGTIKFKNPHGGYFVHHVFLDLGEMSAAPSEPKPSDNPIKIDP